MPQVAAKVEGSVLYAFMNNVTKADAEKMYEGLLKGANSVHPRVSTTGRRGYEYYNKLGYVPYDVKINENAAIFPYSL